MANCLAVNHSITLTPGTVVLGVSDDRTKIYIHAIDFSTKEQEVESIKTSLEKIVGGRNIMNHNVIIVIALIIVDFYVSYAHSRCARPITCR